MGNLLVRVARLAFAGLGIAAIVTAISVTGSLAGFFSYFTIESNLLAVAVLLVGGALDPQGRPWVYLRGVMLADWTAFSPWARGSYRAALGWLAVPLAYFAYSLLRGAAVHWYPYPFLNPTHAGGYGRVALYAVVLALLMGLLALAVNAIARWRIRTP